MTFKFQLNDLSILMVVAAIGTVNTQEEPRMLLAAAHIEAVREGSSSPFVVQPDLKTSGEVLDKARKVWNRLQVAICFVHVYFYSIIVQINSVRAVNGVEEEYATVGENWVHDAGIERRSLSISRTVR